MKFILIALLTLLPAYGQDILEGVTEIPKSETPDYHCFVGFFLLEVKMRNDNEDLGSLLTDMGLPESNLLKHMMIRIVNELGEQKIQGEFGVPETFQGDRQAGKYRQAKAKIRWHKQLYDSFLTLVENEGADADSIHNHIIAEGRDMVQVMITGSGTYDEAYKEALSQFEAPGSSNTWLE